MRCLSTVQLCESYPSKSLFIFFTKNEQLWHQEYCLYVWLNKLCLVPFDVSSMDSGSNLVDSLVDRSKRGVFSSGRPSDGAAEFLAHLLAREDMSRQLEEVICWCLDERFSSNRIRLLAKILKHGSRKTLLKLMTPRLELMSQLLRSSTGGSSLERLHRSKLVQRSCLLLLPPKLASWRYRRGARIIFQSTASIAHDKGLDGSSPADLADYGEECLSWSSLTTADVQYVEDSIDTLLHMLADRDTIVRWSAAKGLGRVTGRLPQVLAGEVCQAILVIPTESVRDEFRWHGSCLALAELARRGLVVPSDGLLNPLVQIIAKALRFDAQRGSATVGSQVRDAACYVCWAVARAYAAEDISSFGRTLAEVLVPAALFDREISCRRAASAALQECVGRVGKNVIPQGLELLPLLDFYTLADRRGSYCYLAPKVALLSAGIYLGPLVEELIERKLCHWDENIRELAAQSLGNLCDAASDDITVENVVSTLAARATAKTDPQRYHGALHGLASTLQYTRTEGKAVDAAREIVAAGYANRVAKGNARPDEILALSLLVAALANCGYYSSDHTGLQAPRAIVLEALSSRAKAVYSAGSTAALALTRISSETEADLVQCICDGIEKEGFAFAAISLTNKNLSEPVRLAAVNSERPEARKNATRALVELAEKGIVNADTALETLIQAGSDYQLDSRGDVGSWVREEAVEGISKLFTATSNALAKRALGVLVRQVLERLDRVRTVAMRALLHVAKSDTRFPEITGVISGKRSDLGRAQILDIAPLLFEIDYVRKDALLGVIASATVAGSLSLLARQALFKVSNVEVVLDLYVESRGDKRLSCPILQALELLVSQNLPDDGPWSLRCADEICSDLKGSRDIARLESTVSLLLNLLSLPTSACRASRALSNLLCHPIPRVRRLAAEGLYFHFISGEGGDDVVWACEVIGETLWESTPVRELQPIRDRISAIVLTSLIQEEA
mmetsp:Transcript_760/g.1863  ORF Transcript_760/g.1863 Transcript_760/m.1863 type:complete len:968 (-) Transcript_760:184-3087(-)